MSPEGYLNETTTTGATAQRRCQTCGVDEERILECNIDLNCNNNPDGETKNRNPASGTVAVPGNDSGNGTASARRPIPLLLRRCLACKSVWYCSVACQRKDWKRHKKYCRVVSAWLELNQMITSPPPPPPNATTATRPPMPSFSLEQAQQEYSKVMQEIEKTEKEEAERQRELDWKHRQKEWLEREEKKMLKLRGKETKNTKHTRNDSNVASTNISFATAPVAPPAAIEGAHDTYESDPKLLPKWKCRAWHVEDMPLLSCYHLRMQLTERNPSESCSTENIADTNSKEHDHSDWKVSCCHCPEKDRTTICVVYQDDKTVVLRLELSGCIEDGSSENNNNNNDRNKGSSMHFSLPPPRLQWEETSYPKQKNGSGSYDSLADTTEMTPVFLLSIRLSYTVRTSRMKMPDAFDLLSTEQAERLACRSCGQPIILLLPSSSPYSNKNGNIQSDDSERRIKRVLRLPSGHFADEEMTDYLQCWSGESAVDFRGSNLFSDFGEGPSSWQRDTILQDDTCVVLPSIHTTSASMKTLETRNSNMDNEGGGNDEVATGGEGFKNRQLCSSVCVMPSLPGYGQREDLGFVHNKKEKQSHEEEFTSTAATYFTPSSTSAVVRGSRSWIPDNYGNDSDGGVGDTVTCSRCASILGWATPQPAIAAELPNNGTAMNDKVSKGLRATALCALQPDYPLLRLLQHRLALLPTRSSPQTTQQERPLPKAQPQQRKPYEDGPIAVEAIDDNIISPSQIPTSRATVTISSPSPFTTVSSFVARQMVKYAETKAIYSFRVMMTAPMNHLSVTKRQEGGFSSVTRVWSLLLRLVSWDTSVLQDKKDNIYLRENQHTGERSTLETNIGSRWYKVAKILFEVTDELVSDDGEGGDKGSNGGKVEDPLWMWENHTDWCCAPPPALQQQKSQQNRGLGQVEEEPMNVANPSDTQLSASSASTSSSVVKLWLPEQDWRLLEEDLFQASQFYSESVVEATAQAKTGRRPPKDSSNSKKIGLASISL